HLVEVTVDVDGDRGGATDSVTATGEHPFWVPNRDEWVDAADLQAGDRVRTAEGEQRLVTSIRTWTALQRVHNLTINNTHTYYVALNGHDETLVHNSGDRPCGPDPEGNIVYRALAEGEDPSVGLHARAPNKVNAEPVSHVAGLKESPWISTSKEPSIAFDKYNQGHGVVAIDSRFVERAEDISSGPFTSRRHRAYARKDQEVLIFRHVPVEAIVGRW
ncbi:Pretoxin HINT domain-containing protein, partial [Actinopolyspora alba]